MLIAIAKIVLVCVSVLFGAVSYGLDADGKPGAAAAAGVALAVGFIAAFM